MRSIAASRAFQVQSPSFVSALRRALSGKPREWITVDDPYTGDEAARVSRPSTEELLTALEQSHSAWTHWRNIPLDERITRMKHALDTFEASKTTRESLALQLTAQLGKPLRESRNEVAGLLKRSRTLLELAPEALKTTKWGMGRSIVRESRGVVLVLAPWNYPLLTAGNALISALLAGDTVLLKHADRSPLAGEALSRMFDARTLGIEHLVQSVHASHEQVANTLIASPLVQFVAFTGSVEGGIAVQRASSASESQRFIETSLELGGKDAAYVADTDGENSNIELLASRVVEGALYNAGQSCCAVERVYVIESIYEQFVQAAKMVMERDWKVGDPRLETTALGPMAMPGAPRFLQVQVDQAKQMGARILCGGRTIHDEHALGRFFEPTMIADCTHEMSVMVDESFGPLLAAMPVKDDAHAIELINDSAYGLTCSIWTGSVDRVRSMAPDLDVGTVLHNACDTVDATLPWSGRKDSGTGLSLSTLGIQGMTRPKAIVIRGTEDI